MPPRRLTGLVFAVLALALPAGASAQGSAGDDQYQDPFGATGTTSTQAASSAAADGLTQTARLAPAPRAPASRTATTPSPPPSAAADDSSQAAAQLPNTGADPRPLALAGLALLLAGIGLRLRTADDRF